ncbi:uncharacterized protein B0P05DRAFT_591236 [Gilbertella persicaria]|uniref:uncharacterized protein n=1 Tax=Gilbertella persicaria TaxID=101096 RepID=UPI0022200ACC|nr:uncharacterized protein B0P05DRAFT_591236 [Gilbertella persicaria]KAI8057537.1 hypothetical protein B0P05DRAFT_591236 [Gilbertella persicaria]
MATLIQYQLTCKYWHMLLKKIIYRNITIKTYRQLVLFIRTISTPPSSPGLFTKQLYITSILDSQYEQAMFNHLIELMHEVYDGRWKYLNALQYPREYKEYAYCNHALQDYQHHHTLPIVKPHFKLHTLKVTKPIFDENTMAYITTKFPNLKKISLGDEFNQIQPDLTHSNPVFSQQVLNRFACYLQELYSYLVLNLFAENMSDVVRTLTGTALNVYFTVNHESQESSQLCAILSKTKTSIYENGMHLKSRCNNYTLTHFE